MDIIKVARLGRLRSAVVMSYEIYGQDQASLVLQVLICNTTPPAKILFSFMKNILKGKNESSLTSNQLADLREVFKKKPCIS